jgi:EAL domain-containing protein (putative c-di-GMP-specific phosphodiesterase class I)
VLQQACEQFMCWQSQGLLPKNASVSINLSARQFMNRRIVDAVSRTLSTTGITPENLTLEITESMLVDDVQQAEATLGEIHRLGVKIGIDDFGTGYSSLVCLKRFPLDHLKVDKSFLFNIEDSKENEAITSAVIHLAHALGLTVIAEGVETEEALQFIADHNCDAYQGYLFSPAISREEFTDMLSDIRPHKSKAMKVSN